MNGHQRWLQRPPLRKLILPLSIPGFSLVRFFVIDIPVRYQSFVGDLTAGLLIGYLLGEMWEERK